MKVGKCMNFENSIQFLLNEFPELSDQYEEEKFYLEGLAYLVFEIIFVPYIIHGVNCKNLDDVSRAFKLIEDMVICPDEKVQELAVIAVLEPLVPER